MVKVNNKKKILVTSALPYVNNVPHLGNLVCILSADVYTRFLRLKKDVEVISVLGTDEHGTTTENIAKELGMTPQEAVDHFFKIHKEIYEWFEFDFDCFGRTTSPENKEITQDIFLKLKEKGFIVEREIEQMYDKEAEKFLSDRFIEGTCPHCNYEEARGDQCENCGKLLNPTELLKPKSKLTGSIPVVKKTKHLFITLDKLQPKLESFVKEREKKWSDNALTTTNAWLNEGLKERAITRDLKWGIPVPEKGYEDKVFYVWFDAPIGYIAITKAVRKDWEEWWHNPKNVKLVQFMGKDNIPFHTILFPASLIGAQDNYTLLDSISVNEYLNYENLKFSKSRGVGVFGDDAKESGILADAWRYYLTVNRPENSDTKFMWVDFQEKINTELVGNIGNLVNRTLTFLKKFTDSKINEIKEPLDYSQDIKQIILAYEENEQKKAIKLIMALSKKGNQYFQENEPWKAIKENPEKAQNALAVLLNLIKDLSILIQPIMPKIAESIQEQLGIKRRFDLDFLNEKIQNHKIGEPVALFKKLEDKELIEFKEKYSGKKTVSKNKTIDRKPQTTDRSSQSADRSSLSADILAKIDLRVAKIIDVQKHPKADKLYIEKLDCGNGEQRTIVSGLVPYYSAEELIGKNIIVVYNLKPAELRGVLSQGMLLAAGQGKDVGVLHCPNAKPGEKIRISNQKSVRSLLSAESGSPSADYSLQAAVEISIDEFFSVKINATNEGVFIANEKLELDSEILVDKNLQGPVK